MWTCPKCGEKLEDQFDSCWKCAGAAQNVNQRTPWVWRGIIVALMVLQFIFLARIWADGGSFNLAKVSYRREQRLAAIKSFENTPSPENKAAMQNEFLLAGKYVGRRHMLYVGEVAAAILIPETVVLYLWRRRARSGPYPTSGI